MAKARRSAESCPSRSAAADMQGCATEPAEPQGRKHCLRQSGTFSTILFLANNSQ
jgi:hypothetical protein